MTPNLQTYTPEEIRRATAILAEANSCGVIIRMGWRHRNSEWPFAPWTLAELEAISHVLERYTQAAGAIEHVQQALGGAVLVRSHRKSAKTRQNWHWIILSDYTFEQPGLRTHWGPQIAISHELAHYWDYRTGHLLSKIFLLPGTIVGGLPEAVQDELGPTWWGRTVPVEQWAEMVAMYLYPEYQIILEQENDPKECFTVCQKVGEEHRLPGLGPRHLEYVQSWFASLRQATR